MATTDVGAFSRWNFGGTIGALLARFLPAPPPPKTEGPPSITEIKARVCEHFEVTLMHLDSDRQARAIARPRQVAMYLCSELTPQSLPAIGRQFGNRDHSTVRHAIKTIERLITDDLVIAAAVASLRAELARP